MNPEVIGVLKEVAVLIDRESRSVILGTTPPIKFSIDHPCIQGSKMERDARAALGGPKPIPLTNPNRVTLDVSELGFTLDQEPTPVELPAGFRGRAFD